MEKVHHIRIALWGISQGLWQREGTPSLIYEVPLQKVLASSTWEGGLAESEFKFGDTYEN